MKWVYKPKLEGSPELVDYGPMMAQLLFARGLTDKLSAKAFLNPSLKDIPDFSLLPNIKKAVSLITKAIKNNKSIFIYGDYDVDGICASSVIFDYLYRHVKANVIPYIPNRFDEGYGLNDQALKSIKDKGADLVITVDCGIRDAELVKKHFKAGLNFIITDHHALPEGKLDFPKDVPIVHPGIENSEYPNKNICATNVAWKLVQALEEKLKIGVDVYKYLDVVGLATVCDVMPLIGENRVIVKHGLEVLKQGENLGLLELLIRNNLDFSHLDSYHYGFVLGPRLNAAGRMEDALIGLKILTTKDKKSVALLAEKLEKLNRERQALTTKYLEEAEIQAASQMAEGQKLIIITGKNWSEGIVGLVAGKLTEKYGLPVIVASDLENEVKGSARSVNGFNITDAISTQKDKLLRFGGHSQAAGFTAKKELYADFVKDLQNVVKNSIDPEKLIKALNLDADIDEENLNLDFVKNVELLKPFGYGNSTPIFALKQIEIIKSNLVGRESKHLKVIGKTKRGKIVDGIAFYGAGMSAKIVQGSVIDIAASLDVNTWNGQDSLQINIKDVKDEKDNK